MTGPCSVSLPQTWVERVTNYDADGGPSGADWIRTVPSLITNALDRWSLVVDGEPRTGWTAVVIPVLRGTEELALKVSWPHTDGDHEHLALRLWDGHAAVRLVAADPASGTLLLERLDAETDLTTMPPEQACTVVGGLLGELGIPAPAAVADLTAYLRPHLERMATRPGVPRRVAERTRSLFADLSARPQPTTLLHTDLHYENVLRGLGSRDRWLAIDPKPVRGHPGFDLLPLLWNRADELEGRPFRTAMRRRLEIAADAAGIEVDEAYVWSLIRAGVEVSWSTALEDADQRTTLIALTKALDD
jgi:streptomycin 6-kinase